MTSIKIGVATKFNKDIKRLKKKYPNVRSDVQVLVQTLLNGDLPGDKVKGVGYDVYKIRIKSRDIPKGKSGGYRVIYYVRTADYIILATIYVKPEKTDISAEEIRRIIDEFENQENED